MSEHPAEGCPNVPKSLFRTVRLTTTGEKKYHTRTKKRKKEAIFSTFLHTFVTIEK